MEGSSFCFFVFLRYHDKLKNRIITNNVIAPSLPSSPSSPVARQSQEVASCLIFQIGTRPNG